VSLIKSRERIADALLAIGSHDNTLDILDSMLRKRYPRYSLTSANVGSLGGLLALKNGRCHLAGSHLLGEDGIYNQTAIKEHLQGLPVHVLRLADREQGIITPRGNPLALASLRDLAREGLRFINRQRGSGTRVLLDYKLRQAGLRPASILGYENEEYTHMQIAAAVLSGRADAGLGVKAAADALGLDFIPVGVEEYDLIIPSRYWQDTRMEALIEVVRSSEFQEAMLALGGYAVEKSGELIWIFEG
jgi:putative molybdopterin biosynthesis protein